MRTFLVLALALAGCASPIATLTESELVSEWRFASTAAAVNQCLAMTTDQSYLSSCQPSRLFLMAGGALEVRSEFVSNECRSGERVYRGTWRLEPLANPNTDTRIVVLTVACSEPGPTSGACSSTERAGAILCEIWRSRTFSARVVNGAPELSNVDGQIWTRAPR
jgi:hypothetical protein